MHPPDLQMRSPAKAATSDRANRKPEVQSTATLADELADRQAASLRRRFALGHYLAVTVAQLAWAALPR